MPESHLVSQLIKVIEDAYKEKVIIEHKIAQITEDKRIIDEKIVTFENALLFLDPDVDLRCIRTKFDVSQLIKKRLFHQSIKLLIAKVFRKDNKWRDLYFLTRDVIEIDKEESNNSDSYDVEINRQTQKAVANALRNLYKQGIIERRERYLHHKVKYRGFFQRSEWRLKPLEQK